MTNQANPFIVSHSRWKVALIREFLRAYATHATDEEFAVMNAATVQAAGDDLANELTMHKLIIPDTGDGFYECIMHTNTPYKFRDILVSELKTFSAHSPVINQYASLITVIKLVRALTDYSLRDAKDCCERVIKGEKVTIRIRALGHVSLDNNLKFIGDDGKWKKTNIYIRDLETMGFEFEEV